MVPAPGGLPLGTEQRESVTFTVANTDPDLPTANEGGEYPFTVRTTSAGVASETDGALNLAPPTVVPDDALGTVVSRDDAKRHWRTDSVEITIDPRGDSRDTSTTYKVGLFPTTHDPEGGTPPAGYRDADAHQGPIAETAPGTELAATVTEPYEGYTIETRIDLADLPSAVGPDRMG